MSRVIGRPWSLAFMGTITAAVVLAGCGTKTSGGGGVLIAGTPMGPESDAADGLVGGPDVPGEDVPSVDSGADSMTPPLDVGPSGDTIAPPDTVPTDIADMPPSVTIASPPPGATVSGTTEVVVVTQDDMGIAEVRFSLDGDEAATVTDPPFTWAWDTTLSPNGPTVLRVVAYDTAGQPSEPAEVDLVVSNALVPDCDPPEVAVSYPSAGAVLCGDVPVDVSATAECGVERVELFVDGAKVAEVSKAPFMVVWSTTGGADGAHLLKVVVHDAAGQKSQTTLTVTVDNAVALCKNAPVAMIIEPLDGAFVSGAVAFKADASAAVGYVDHVVLTVDSKKLALLDAEPYEAVWATDAAAEGPHVLEALAYDDAGDVGTAQVVVTVDRTPPSVELQTPSAGALVSGVVKVVATAFDNGALAGVVFAATGPAGKADLGTIGAKPFETLWDTTGFPSGSYVISAVAKDKVGLDAEASLQVSLDRPPVVSLDAPADLEIVSGAVLIKGSTSDDIGVAAVEVVVDEVPLAAPPGGAFSVSWDTGPVAAGEHLIRVTATDTAAQKTSLERTVTVDPGVDISMLFCTDASYATCGAPPPLATGVLHILGDAVSGSNPPVEMRLLVGAAPVAVKLVSPFGFEWDSETVPDGPITLGLEAIFASGAKKTVHTDLLVSNCDLDGDGHPAYACGGDDCDDSNAGVHPGAPEPADGLDNDCNGVVDDVSVCSGACTGSTVDAALCALDLCATGVVTSASVSSPTNDDISKAWVAVSHFGAPGNDLSPKMGPSYALLSTGPAAGTNHSVDLAGGGATTDPFAKDGYPTYDVVELTLEMTAPVNATGISVDTVFFSVEYEEYVGTSFNDKFYIMLTAPETTGGKKQVINGGACSNPSAYYDYVDSEGQKSCYMAINTAFSEPCAAPKTNIAGTGFECGAPDSSHGSSTGWLVTSWPIEGGEKLTLTFHIHDTSDGIYDSEVILDNLRFETGTFVPGTHPL